MVELSKYLKNNSREKDTICRFGGEEFIIILPETTSNGALNYAERLKNEVKEVEIFKKNKITFSGGISTYPYDGNTLKELLSNADKSLYIAKYSGKDCFINSNEEKRRYKRFIKTWKLLYQPLESMFKNHKITETYHRMFHLETYNLNQKINIKLILSYCLTLFYRKMKKFLSVGK